MEESLGSGFDSIRAALLSPTTFASQVTVSSAFTQTTTDLEIPVSTYVHLAGAESLADAGEILSLSSQRNLRFETRNIAPTSYSSEIECPEQSTYSGDELDSEFGDVQNSESRPYSASFDESSIEFRERLSGIEQDTGIGSYTHHALPEWGSPHQSEDEEYESDPDDTCKFYTECNLHARLEDDCEDSDDLEDYDYESDSDYEHARLGQMMASINRYDYRYHRYWDSEHPDLANPHLDTPLQATQERNFTVCQFIRHWLQASLTNSAHVPPQFPCPSLEADNVWQWMPPRSIHRPKDIEPDEFYDIQQIPWSTKLGVHRQDARVLRDAWYSPYSNLECTNYERPRVLPKSESYFLEKALFTSYKATIEHFQLRNLMAVTSFNTVEFASQSQLLSFTPDYASGRCVMDLTRPSPEAGFRGPVKISTMQSKHGVSVAGGFSGEYCMHVNGSQPNNGDTYGFVTTDLNGITNNIDIIRSRANWSPLVVFASNDQHIRTLDSARNQFISDHELPIPVNCSQTSADGRLRVVVGDSPEAFILEADSGRTVQQLRGHRDFGFACAWSPDMQHIATSNQDRTVNIWDVRMWRILQSMDSDSAGYRSLRFSPVGGGPRTLLMSEPADRIAIVNATTYETRQVHDFFGEIGGADYTPDGGAIWVANTDETFGGLMKFERMQYGLRYGSSQRVSKHPRSFAPPSWYSDLPHEWISETELENDDRCVVSQRERDFRALHGLSDEARDNLLI